MTTQKLINKYYGEQIKLQILLDKTINNALRLQYVIKINTYKQFIKDLKQLK